MMLLTASLVGLALALVVAPAFLGRSSRSPTPAAPRPAAVPTASRWADRRRRLVSRLQRAPHVVQPAEMASWADDLSRALRHGSTLHAALTHTIPTDVVVEQRSASLRHWLGRGATVAEACDEWSVDLAEADAKGRPTGPGDRLELISTMSAVLSAAASLGGTAAAPLDRFAVTMRQRASDDLERGAQSAQAQMSAKVLTSVPLAVLALLLLTDDGVRGVVASATGGIVVALGLVLNAAGAMWMTSIAGTATR